MAINLKLETKIVEVVNNVQIEREVFAHSASEPIFRQNGYEVNGDKKSFAIAFDKVESEFFFDSVATPLTKVNQINFDLTISKQSLGGQIFSIGRSSDGLFSVYQTSGGLEIVDVYDNTGVLVYNNILGTFAELDTDVKYTFDGATVTRDSPVSGVVSLDLSSVSNTDINIATGRNITVCRLSYLNSRFASYTLKELTYLSVKYPLTEGLGNEIWSEDKTNKGTLITNHAGGVDRINFGMWLKGDDVNGWTPYTL